MRLRRSLGTVVIAAVIPSSLVAGHLLERDSPWRDQSVIKRAGEGAACGASAGNSVCDHGLCCSESGICGTGGAFCSAPACQLSYGPGCDGNQVPAGATTANVPRPRFGHVPYGVDISHCSVRGKVALTFDDGPYIHTAKLLDTLKKNNVSATFFIVGNNAGKGQISDPESGYTPIIQRMIADGHQVGSHTWSHQDMNAITPQQRRAQIINNEIALANVLGVIPSYFRPPYTLCDVDCYNDLASLGYHVVNYDVDTRDWENNGIHSKSIYQSILTQGSSSSSQWLSLAHDVQEHTVHQLAQFMIDTAKGHGYQLVTVGECLGDPPENWYRDPRTGASRNARGASPTPVQRVPTSARSTTTSANSTVSVATPSSSDGMTPSSSMPGVVETRASDVGGRRAVPLQRCFRGGLSEDAAAVLGVIVWLVGLVFWAGG
ncbi:hypothetical protein QBC34DRAFT_151174 [Podospora aff. communis PSN243]|uniref:Carbohydrate Esterase Family 4 n=1 Tax=Podospora aff. communis PSN243 TaxID=3040156 RepID=A0AAV9GH34_9PEZI|nr:hypothetical protein QBC34DRAFT_151174 [Podospora aff. communis PSN243]